MRWSTFLFIWLACLTVARVPAGAQSLAASDYVKVYGMHTVGQKFTYPLSNLDRVAVWFRKPGVSRQDEVIFRLKKTPDAAQDIVVIRVSTAEIQSEAFHWFLFRPLGDYEENTFYFQVESPGADSATAVRVRLDEPPLHGLAGQMYLNGEARPGAVAFQVITTRSLTQRISYVLARFEIDKPWFYNRYLIAAVLMVMLAGEAAFLWYTYRLLNSKDGVRAFTPLIMVCFLLRGTVYSILFPAWQAPDEPSHFGYIRDIGEYRRLTPAPNLPSDVLDSMERADFTVILRGGRPVSDWQTWIHDSRAISLDRTQAPLTTGGVPPFYHVMASLPYRLVHHFDILSQLYLLRLLSVLLGGLTVYLGIRMIYSIFPEDRAFQLLVSSVLCLHPMFTYISAIVNYDAMTNLLYTLSLLLLIEALRREMNARTAILIGVCVGLTLLTKVTAVTLAPVAAVYLAVGCWKASSKGRLIRHFLLGALVAGVVGGWWHLRTLQAYMQSSAETMVGDPNVIMGAIQSGEGPLPRSALFSFKGFDIMYGLFTSFWGNFGWLNLPLMGWMYGVFGLFSVLALIGSLRWIDGVRRETVQLSVFQKKAMLFLTLAIVVHASGLCIGIKNIRLLQGRYWFPVIVPMMLWFGLGLCTRLPRSWHQGRAVWGIVLGLALLEILILTEVIIPRYYLIPPPSKLLQYIS